ncbi:hypothetical protein rsdtw13_29280 [Clostridium sp. TW13]|uniref:Uncharacterized protein n=1 Tax=Inconstantimicrobium mannanitabidum TaxID=1604901 RepID=A0ACB5REY7_9CLOT|nr:hypothetical protein rsdtw13_29280 [Clostridium sp. TW13]
MSLWKIKEIFIDKAVFYVYVFLKIGEILVWKIFFKNKIKNMLKYDKKDVIMKT